VTCDYSFFLLTLLLFSSAPSISDSASSASSVRCQEEQDEKASLTPAELELTERQVALLMEQDMGMAMQYLQSKGLCLMPMGLASMMNKGQGQGQGGQGGGQERASHPGQGKLEGGNMGRGRGERGWRVCLW